MFENSKINTAVTAVQHGLGKSVNFEASLHVRDALNHKRNFALAVNHLKAGMTKYHAVATVCLIRALLAEAEGSVDESGWFRRGASIAMEKDGSKTMKSTEIDEFLGLRENELRETWAKEIELVASMTEKGG